MIVEILEGGVTVQTMEVERVQTVEVQVPGVQGPPGPLQLVIGAANTLLPGRAGLWVQTGIGPNGEDFTMWIEDGT